MPDDRPPEGEDRDAALAELRRQRDDYERKAAELDELIGDVEAPPVELPTLARAVEGFLARQTPPGDRAWFPWPGGQEGMPEDAPRSRLAAGDVLPPEGGYQPREWDALWRMVGPLWPDRLAVLVGATGRGKSGLALNVAESVARAGHPVLYLSAEMGTDELVARLIALRARERARERGDDWGIAWRTVLMGGAPREDLERACAELVEDCPRLYPWAPRADARKAECLEKMTRAVVKGGRPPLVVVDYLQRMAEGEDLRGAVRSVSGTLRDLSRPDGLGEGWPGAAVLALSSTGRTNYGHLASVDDLRVAAEGGERWITDREKKHRKVAVPPVSLEGLGKESGELETDASLLLVMTTNKGDGAAPRDGLVVVAKNRHGGTGRVPFTFYPVCGRFAEGKAPDGEEDGEEVPPPWEGER